jgi:hypothetical protein
MKDQRSEQRITRLLEKKEKLDRSVEEGRLTEAEALLQLDKAKKEAEADSSGAAPSSGGDAEAELLTEEKFDPYGDEKSVVHVGQEPAKEEVAYLKSRFSNTNVFTIEQIKLTGEYSNMSYPAWGVKYVPAGRSDAEEAMTRKGKKVSHLSLSLSLLNF